MKKILISLAVIATLPFGATAENISGAMYTAPSAANNDHPAPTTNAYAPYGRIDIDTTDQDHIASTAYVKGAYNSAIAGINKVKDYAEQNKQDKFYIDDDIDGIVDDFDTQVIGSSWFLESLEDRDVDDNYVDRLVSAKGILTGILSQRVEVYTNWDDDDATTDVAFKTVVPEED